MGVSGGDYTAWTYDARGRVETEAKQIPGGGQFVTSFTYNSADLPVTMTYPDMEVVTFTYNSKMLPISVIGTDTYAQSIAYDSANRMKEIIRGVSQIDTDYTYNAWNADGGRLLNLSSTQVSTSDALQNLTYDYDQVGNINTIVDALSGPQTQTFTYDALDRLLSSDVSGGSNGLYSESYSYDGTTGNLASKGGVNYTYNSGHAHGVSSLDNGNSYGYDANGNMTSRSVGGQSFTLTYDAENRLVAVSGAATASFAYDADGKQVIGTVNGVTTYYVGNHYEVKSGVATKYYFAGATRLAVRTGDTLSFLLADHLGSSSVTTDANGAPTASALYKAFGETRYTLGNLNTDYKFTGQRDEPSLGIYWFQSRWYDGALGRFTQPDSIVPTGTQGTQAWDRYAFVNNNPVRYNDPTGHQIQGDTPPPPKNATPTPPTPCTELTDPSCVIPPTPQTTIGEAPQYPSGTHIEYESYMDWGSVDWLHIITNGAGVVGDIATAMTSIGFAPAAPVAYFTQVIDGVGIAMDIVDVFVDGDISGLTWDGMLAIAEQTKFGRIVPILGFGLNVDGVVDAWNEGKVTYPVLVPNPPVFIK